VNPSRWRVEQVGIYAAKVWGAEVADDNGEQQPGRDAFGRGCGLGPTFGDPGAGASVPRARISDKSAKYPLLVISGSEVESRNAFERVNNYRDED
jgi:hypothetical protein